MARVNLRDYLREIDDLIENGRTDEAIAHSRYILELYPKHIDTYRLLGKAYLENQRYSDAADVLQRVLSSIPDDFISNLGMSIIREDEGNLDAAIFYMERAFEVQPSNAAIQEELRRLYGRRDGLEPSKIHLTRGALARMYAKGELYEQAIAEIRATLAQEPQRTDLQVLLAQLYVKNGQHVDAVRTCSNIIQKFPYCKDANQILVEKLPGTQRAEETQNYRRRLQALDPYSAHISASAPNTQHVPDNVITLDRYIWTPGDTGSDSEIRPDWAISLGVDIDSSTSDEEKMPEWLVEKNDTDQTPAFEPGSVDIESISNMDDKIEPLVFDPQDETDLPNHTSPQIEDDSADSEDQIPEWMKSAGWELSVTPSEETQSQFNMDDNSAINDDEPVPAEIPDWLQSKSPVPNSIEHKSPESEDDGPSDEPVNWLDEKTPGATDSIVTWLQTKDHVEGVDDTENESLRATDQASIDGKPDWLQDFDEETPNEIRDETSKDLKGKFESADDIELQGDEHLADENIPEWLRDLSDQSPIIGTSDLLEETGSDFYDGSSKPIEEYTEREQDLGEPAIIEENLELPSDLEIEPLNDLAKPEIDIPEWLKSLGNENVIDEDLYLPEDHEVLSLEDTIQSIEHEQPLEDLTEWSQTLEEEPIGDVPVETSLDQFREPLEEIGDPDLATQPKEGIPGWLEDLSTELSIDESQRSSEEIGELTVGAVISEEAASSKTGETPEWVQALGSETSAEESADSEAGLPEDIPELLAALDKDIKPEETFESRLSKTGETLMDHEEEIPELGPDDEDAALAWMESLAAKQGVDEEELLTTPDERQITPPDWIQQLSTQSEPIEQEDEETIVAITTGKIDESAGQIPDLELESSSSLSPETTSEPIEENEAIPDWLQVLMEETTPEEQTPVLDVQSTGHMQTVEESEPTDDLVPDWILELAEESVDIPTEHTLDKPAMIEGDTQPITITEGEPGSSEVFSPELEVVQDIASSEQEIDLESTETNIEEKIEADSLYPFDEAETIPYTADEIPDWLKEEDISKSALPAVEETKEQEFETPEWLAAEDVEESIQPTETSQIDQSKIADDELEIPEWIIDSDLVEEVSDTYDTIQSLEENLPGDELEIPEGDFDAFSAETKLSEPFKAVGTELPEKQPETPAELVSSAVEEPSVIPTTEQPFTDEKTKMPDWISADQEETELETVESIQPLEVEKKDEEPEITEWMEAEKVADWFEESKPVESVEVDITEEIKPVPERLEKIGIEDITDTSVSTDFPKIPDESFTETLVVESPPTPVNINTASLMTLERLPGIGPVLAQTIINYRETHGNFSSVDSLQDVPGIGEKNLEILRDHVDVEIKEELVSISDISEEIILSDGRSALNKGDISKAYDRYSKLIEDEQMLDKVIEDMKDALHRYPIEVSVYELLGDAYLRTDQIQAAIDTYTKAEELLT